MHSQRISRRSFTFVEVLFTILVTSLLSGALLYALNTGQFSHAFSSTQADLQAEVRRLTDWVSRDARETVPYEINNNNPSQTHIKFRKVQGWNTTSEVLLWSSNYFEYTYDAASKTITRSDGGQTLVFNNIIQPPFYTKDTSGNTVPLSSAILDSKILIIVIAGEKQVKDALKAAYTLTAEVRIRNNG